MQRIFGDKDEEDEGEEGGFRHGPKSLQDLLTSHIPVEILSDQAEFLRQAIDEVKSAAVWGGFLAVLVLYLFLGNLIDTLIVAIVIPISLVAAFAAMNYWNVTLNVMSLGGLALGIGMMVDNSIVVVESIFRRREEGDNITEAAVNGTRIVGGAVIASTTTTVVVFFPVVFVTGVAGQIFNDLSMTVIIAIMASMMIALFYVPMLIVKLRSDLKSQVTTDSPVDPRIWFVQAISQFKTSLRYFQSLKLSTRIVFALIWFPYISIRLLLELLAAAIGYCATFLLRGGQWMARKPGSSVYRKISIVSGAFVGGFNSGFNRFGALYSSFLKTHLKRPLLIIVIAIVASVVITIIFLPGLGSELIPEVSQGIFDARFSLPIGTSLDATDRIVRSVEEKIKGHPEVIGISSRVGSDPTDANALEEGTHTGTMTVRLKSGKNLPARETEVIQEIRQIVADTPSLKLIVTHPTLFTFKQPVEIIIKGDDLNQLKQTVTDIERALTHVSNLSDIETSVKPGNPEITIQFNRERLALLNTSQRSIAEVIKSSVLGTVASKFQQVEHHIDIRVNLQESDRKSVEEIAALIINPGDPIPLRLSEVATLRLLEGPAEIRHTDGVRSAVITAGISGLDLGHVTESIDASISTLAIPPELSIELGGQHREMEESLTSLYWALLLAVFLVYVAMASQFESFAHPLLILFTIPFAVVGVIPVLWLFNIPLSIMVFLGLIILVGVVVDNSIVLIDYAVQLRRDGMALTEALATAAEVRLRPIFMTTLTTVLGLFPMVVGLGEGAEMRRPMAITVMAGLLLGTIVTLVLIPLIYRLVAKDRPTP